MLPRGGRITARIAGATALLASLCAGGSPRAAPPPEPAPVVPPRRAPAPDVAYPEGAKGDAVVVLLLTVGKDGAVRAVEIDRGDEPFASAAKEAAAGWHFEPATREGKPVGARIRFEVVFHGPVIIDEPPPPPEAPPSPAKASPPKPGAPPPRPPAAPIEVVIRADKPPPSVSTLSRAEVRQLPGAFGDPFRAIEVLPGVTPIVSGLPFFYVRGAPPGNVGYYLDGVRVPYLYHVAVGPSIVNPAMMEKVDLYSGGYPARYGRYAGAIVSGETTAPRDDWHGEGNIRIFDAGAMVEGGFAGGRGTALVGGRYSYTGAIFSLISPTTKLDYRDYQARVTFDVTPKDRLSLFAFGAYDLLAQVNSGIETIVFGSEFYRFDARYDHKLPNSGALRWAATWGFDQTRVGEQRNARDVLFGTRVELTQPVGRDLVVHAGADAQFDAYSADPRHWADPEDPDTKAYDALFPPRVDGVLGAYADVAWKMDRRVELTPGLRADLFRSGGASATSLDARLSLNVDVTPHVRLLHALGLAHQPPSFIVPLAGVAVGKLQGGLQTSLQASAGVEMDLPLGTTATVSLFDDVFLNMTDTLGVRPPGDPSTSEPRSLGSAYGLEVYLRKRLTSHVGGFVSYTLSRSTRREGAYVFPSAFDRTHVLNTALAFDIARGWRAGTRFTVYTGAPVLASQASLTPERSSDPPRDPAFYRIDLRVEKRWTLRASRWVSFVIEMMNATLHKETISGRLIGPVSIPSIGVEGGF